MKGSVGACQQCGEDLSDSGRCSKCGADQVLTTATNIGSFIDRIKQFVVLPGMPKPKHGLGDLSLVNKGTSQTYLLSTPVVRIGRDPGNEISLVTDTSISRNHACITFVKDGFWLEDLNST